VVPRSWSPPFRGLSSDLRARQSIAPEAGEVFPMGVTQRGDSVFMLCASAVKGKRA
jgi:hypothetical protein